MNANKIETYEVRVPGNTCWSSHKTLRMAEKERETANRICHRGHEVFARHENGDVSGPY